MEVDFFIVGTIRFDVLERVVKANEEKLGREIHYSVMGEDEFLFRKRRNDQFVSKLLAQGRTMLIGDEEQFSAL